MKSEIIEKIKRQTTALAIELKVKGLMNVQFAVKNEEIYVLEVNPRASRTVPFISKATGIPLAKLGAKLMIGKKIADLEIKEKTNKHIAVKEAVLPFERLPGSDTLWTPEMRSTGEVMGIDNNFEMAFFKSQIAAGIMLPYSGSVFVSIKDTDKTNAMLNALRNLNDIGFILVARFAGIRPISVPNTTNIITAIKTTIIGTDALIKTESGPLPKAESIAIKIQPPLMIPKIPAIIVKKIDSITICLFISKGVAPIALLMPISFVLSFTVISRIFPMANTPAIKVAIPTNQVRNCIPIKKPSNLSNNSPRLKLPKARLSSG